MNFEEYVRILNRKIVRIPKDKIVFVCIGNSNVLWDSIGPKIGSYLKEKASVKNIYGDIKSNICSMWDFIKIYPKIRNKYIIAIDTAICDSNLNGKIFINNNPIVMGRAIGRNNGIIGDLSIKIGISKFYINKLDLNFIEEKVKLIGKIINNVKV